MKSLIILSIIALLCVSSASSQYTPECISALTSYATWYTSCSASLSINFATDFSGFTTFCAASTSCSLTQFATVTANLIDTCGGAYSGSARATIMTYIHMLEGLCISVNGHYCLQDAMTFASAFEHFNISNATAVSVLTNTISSTCGYGCSAKLFNLAQTYSSVFGDLSQAFYASSLLCSTSGTSNCFTKFLTFIQAASTKDLTTLGTLVCDPCMRNIASYAAYFSGSEAAKLFSYLPDYKLVCQMNNASKACGPVILSLVSSLNLLTKCTTASNDCLAAVTSLISQGGCCTKSILPFLSTAQATMFSGLPGIPDYCKPTTTDSKLTVTLNLGGVNLTRINEVWDTIKASIIAEFAAMAVVDSGDVSVSLSISGGVATIKITIQLSTTAYTASTLAAYINPLISSGSLQFSVLNKDATLATSTSGVTVASGQAGNGVSSTRTISSVILGIAALSLAAL